MSYSLDANILLYAVNESADHHQRARAFLKERLKDSELMVLAYSTLMAFLRISTHPRIFPNPLAPELALKNIRSLVSCPQVRLIAEKESFFADYEEATAPMMIRGNLVPDAHLAILLQEHGVKTLYTNDSDFRKFAFLNPVNPFL
jgi:hypothetical protein